MNVVFLLMLPKQDPLYFSVQSGKCILPDPGVNVSLCFLPCTVVAVLCLSPVCSFSPGVINFISSCLNCLTFLLAISMKESAKKSSLER